MKALYTTAPGEYGLADRPRPRPAQDEVVLRVKSAGFCYNDLRIRSGVLTEMGFPFVPGHQFAGVVEECGPGVKYTQPGDRVAVHAYVLCGMCASCRTGGTHECEGPRLHRTGAWRSTPRPPRDASSRCRTTWTWSRARCWRTWRTPPQYADAARSGRARFGHPRPPSGCWPYRSRVSTRPDPSCLPELARGGWQLAPRSAPRAPWKCAAPTLWNRYAARSGETRTRCSSAATPNGISSSRWRWSRRWGASSSRATTTHSSRLRSRRGTS